VLLAYSKMVLYAELLKSDLPDDPYFSRDLTRYFPTPELQTTAWRLKRHRLIYSQPLE